ncbi:MAG: transglutaminase-like domain-containing protein [Desulfurococcaceae archaeon]
MTRLTLYTLIIVAVVLGGLSAKLYLDYSALLTSYERLTRSYQLLQRDYETVRNAHHALELQYNTLLRNYAELENTYRQVKADYEAVSSAYQRLQQEYNNLRSQFNALQLEFTMLTELSLRLNSSLSEIITTLTRYCCIPYAFERVLNLDEVKAVEQYVLSAKVYADDPFSSIQNIYRWIRSNVKYVHDVPLPIPMQITCDPKTKLCYYSRFTDLQNYVQTPSFTAKYGQGDCDDQAVLAYAMIKYYFIFVHGKEYDLLIAGIEMGDGSRHLAVFLPVQGGMLTIIDPAGAYLTSTLLGSITARPAYEELLRYSNHWSSHGGVKLIELYRVDVRTGRYRLVVRGDINTVAFYLSLS